MKMDESNLWPVLCRHMNDGKICVECDQENKCENIISDEIKRQSGQR